MARKPELVTRLDDAARAGWLYYVAGRTQDEIAAAMGISRQSAQRLVSLAVAEKLVKVRIDHPIAACLELGSRLKDKFDLRQVEIVPSDPVSPSSVAGLAPAAAAEIERWLRQAEPIVMGIGTGRTLKASIDLLSVIDCPQHRIVSLTGNISPDGSAAYYNVIFSMQDTIKARHFPMPLPVLVSSGEERDLLHAQSLVHTALTLGKQANVAFVGVGELGPDAPLCQDGFLAINEMARLTDAGAVGEICGWMFDDAGNLLRDPINERVASIPLPDSQQATIIGMALGPRKLRAVRAALTGHILNGLITDEATARLLLG